MRQSHSQIIVEIQFDVSKACQYKFIQTSDIREHIRGLPDTANIQPCMSESLSVFVEYSGNSWTGWPFCDKAFTFGCSQKAAEAAGKL